jgi:hypothetical protein
MKALLAANIVFSPEAQQALEDAQESWELLDKGDVDDPDTIAAAVANIVGTLAYRADLFQEAQQLPSQPGLATNRPQGLAELRDMEELLAYMQQFKAVILFNGHGSAGQYGDLAECDRIVDIIVRNVDGLVGTNWLVLYGGEPWKEGMDTIAYPIRRLRRKHGKTVLAVQCDFYGKYILAPSDTDQYAHLENGAVYQYPTTHHLDRRTKKRVIQFGGYDRKGRLTGGSSVWFSEELRNAGFPNGHVLIGGGPIAADEADFCTKNDIPILYARARKKTIDDDMMVTCPAEAYGQMESWANEAGIPRDAWHPYTPTEAKKC